MKQKNLIIIKISKKRGHGRFEYLLCTDETQNNFRLIKHFFKSKRVGTSLLDTSVGFQVFGNDEQLTLLEPNYVEIPHEVVRKIENFKYTAISLWTMGEFEEVRMKMRELKLYLKVNYELYKKHQN